MNYLRATFDKFLKRYCPDCGGRVHRERLPQLEQALRQALFLIPYALCFIVFAGILEHFGFTSTALVILVAGGVTLVIVSPWLRRHSPFSCPECGRTGMLDETLARSQDAPSLSSSGRAEAPLS